MTEDTGLASRIHYARHAASSARRAFYRRRLRSKLPADAVGAEIGVWKGDNAAELLAARRPRHFYLIDPWELRTEEAYAESWFGTHTRSGQEEMDSIYESVLARFAPEIEADRVTVIRERSVQAASHFDDDSLDWVYVDGDHSYEGALADLEAYFSKVKRGGGPRGRRLRGQRLVGRCGQAGGRRLRRTLRGQAHLRRAVPAAKASLRRAP